MRSKASLLAALLVAAYCVLLLPREAVALSFVGCYQEKSQERVFILSPGDYDPDLLATEPVVCTSRCQQLAFSYAAIWQSRFCFCSNSINQTADFNITGIPKESCTAVDYVAVYNAEITATIEDLEVTIGASTAIVLNSAYDVRAMNATSPLSNLFTTRLSYSDDRFRTELIPANGYSTNKSYVQPGVFSIKAQAFQFGTTMIGSGAIQVQVSEPLSGANLTCPPVWITQKSMKCLLSVNSGTGLSAQVNWGDGTTENFVIADAPWERAGTPVATQLTEMQNSSIFSSLVAADFKYAGTLQAFEFFAQADGALDLLILRPACSGGTPFYCYPIDNCAANSSCSSEIDCSATTESLCPATESCWKSVSPTCKTKMVKRNVTSSLSSSFQVAQKYNTTAQRGYNLFPVTDKFQVLPGDKIGFWAASAILAAKPLSVVEGNDFSFTGASPAVGASLSAASMTAQPVQHQISAVSRPLVSVRMDRTYNVSGNYTVSVTLSNAYLTGAATANPIQAVWIQPNIDQVRFVPVTYVLAKEPCNIRLEPHTGVNVMYNWSYSDTVLGDGTNSPISSHVYSSAGPGFINVTAYTSFESKSNSTSFQLIERVNMTTLIVDGQIFGNDSAVTAVLASGTNFNCTFNVSSGSVFTASSNAMRIPAVASVGYYTVTTTCYNFLTSDSRTSLLYVEVPVTTFSLVTKAAEANVAFRLKFQLKNCTHPRFEALFMNISRAMTYNQPLLEVDMEPVTVSSIGKYILVSRAYNNVSDVLLVTNFTLQERIAGLSLSISNAVLQIGVQAAFRITMTAGSGVQISLSYGGGTSYNYTTGDIEPWGGRILLPNTTYATGGDYTVTLNASNLLGFEAQTLTVHVIAPLGIYKLVAAPVAAINTPVSFQLQLVTGSPPSLTAATFNWGDGSGFQTFANIQLNTDYNHTFGAVGQYFVNFNASNPIPSLASNSTSIIVVRPIVNPRVLFTPPVLAKGEVARVIIKVDDGSNITIQLNPGDGGAQSTYWIGAAVTGTEAVLNATYVNNGTFLMSLSICNPYHCFNYTNSLPVVNKLLSSTLGMTNGGNVTFGRPLVFTFNYVGTDADAPSGAMVEVRNASGAVVSLTPLVMRTTQVSILSLIDGYVDYTFFIYNNGSNFTLAGPRIGSFSNVSNLNFTLNYRSPGDTRLISGYGPNKLMFPNKKDLVAMPTTAGYIQGYILSIEPIPVNVSAIKICSFASNESAFKYIEGTGAFEVTLTAWNPVSNATVTMNITVGGSIVGGRVVDNNGISRPGQLRSITLLWDVISDDTCVFVDLGVPKFRYAYGPLNCNITCGSMLNDSYQYTGALVSNNRLDYNVIYDTRGTFQVNVFACNEFTNSTFSGTLAVSSAKCRPPIVVFTDTRYSSPDSARNVLRSELVTIECRIIDLPCELTLSNRREWFIQKLDPSSFGVIGSVNASSLPSSGNTILALPKLFLEVGLYKVTVRVVMNKTITIEEFANSTSMYLRIGSSPIFIALNDGGMSEIKLSTQRQVCLNPRLFSRDLDVNSTSPDSQGIGSWTFHCYQDGEPEPADDSTTPVVTPKPDSFNYGSYTPSPTGCFDKPTPGMVANDGTGLLCFDGRNLLPGKTYNFKVQGTKGTRKGKASLRIQMVSNLPANIGIRCRFLSACRRVAAMTDFQIINPSETAQLSGTCNCTEDPAVCMATVWQIRYLNASNQWVDLDNQKRIDFVQGTSNKEVSFSPQLFKSVSSRKYRVCLNVGNGTSFEGEGCIQLFTNTLPTEGSCSCNASTGVAGVSIFNITCSGYSDEDGIDSYKFFLEKEFNGTKSSLLLGFSQNPNFVGPFPFLADQVIIRVVVADIYGASVSNAFNNITLTKPNSAVTDAVIKSILGGTAPLLKTLNKGDLQDSCSELQTVAAMVVDSSRNSIGALTGSRSVTTAGSGYGDGTTNGERMDQKIDAMSPKDQAIYQKERDDRAKVLLTLTNFLPTMTAVNAKQIELIGTSMQYISSGMDDLPRSAQLGCKNKAVEMVASIGAISDSVSKEEMVAVARPLITSLSQTMSAASTQVNWGINSDVTAAMHTDTYEYDTDWESPRAGFMSSRSTGDAGMSFIKETNGIVQGKVSTEVSNDGMVALGALTNILASKQIQGDEPMKIVTPQLSLVINKTNPDSLSGLQVETGRSRVSLPRDLCSLTKSRIASGQCSGPDSAIAMTAFAVPTNPFVKTPTNNGDCTIPNSAEVVTLNFLDRNGKEIRIGNTGDSGCFEININKDPTFLEPNFTDPNPLQPIPRLPAGVEVPGTAAGPFERNEVIYQKLILHDFQLTGSDQSVHFQVEFDNFTLNVSKCRQFLVVGRLWRAPSLMDKNEGFDWWSMVPRHTRYCYEPPGKNEPDPFTFFVSNDKFNKVKARVRKEASDWDKDVNKVKFGVRELEESEWNMYTENNRPPCPYPYHKQFTIKYRVRIFSASCYAIRPNEASWSTSGCVVGNMTTVRTTQCLCTHLTSFAGGWVESPNTIDWNYVFSNFDFTKNPTLFVTQIVIAVVFIMVFLWARHGDKKDLEKLGVTPLYDNNPEHKYLYEIVVSTGMRRGAGTESRVHFILSGERDETDIRPLEDKKRRVLQRGCVDRFLMAVERPLGSLNFIRIWHDNSGRGSAASWYCNSVVVIDLQTRLRYHFVLNRWLAVEEDDGCVDRVVPVAGLEELKDFNYMFSTQTKKDFTDGHLWLSIMARPPESRFTRVERVACCLFLLFLTMVTTCMFYQKEGPTKASATSGLNIGPFSLTPRMVWVGVVTNIITFVPLFLVMELFRRSRLRVGYINQLKKAIDDHFDGSDPDDFANSEQSSKYKVQQTPKAQPTKPVRPAASASAKQVNVDVEEDEEKPPKRPLRFPWWVRIISWTILIVGTATSAVFTTFYGIQFGDDTCKKWISSLFVSFFASVMLSQPLKVLLVAVFFALLCKKQNSNEEEEFLDDEEEVLNELGQRYGLRGDEEWMYGEDEDGRQRKSGIEPPNAELLERARERRLKEKKMFEIIREIVFYFLFYLLLLLVTFAFRDPNLYDMKSQMVRLFLPRLDNATGEGIPGISTEAQFWQWLETKFIPGIRADRWYNGNPPLFQRGYTGDRVGRLVGYAIMRQKRNKLNTCSVQPSVRYLVKNCIDTYNFQDEEKGNFDAKWQAYNPNTSALPRNEAFRYTSGAQLKSFGPYMARMHTYSPGGYVFQFRGSLKSIMSNITELKTLQWLDKQTRAIFLEFAFYNPNVNLFGIGTVVFELEGSGGMVGIYRFQAANLLSFLVSGVKGFEIACQVLFCIVLIAYMVKEARKMYKERLQYVHKIWNIAEMFILIGSMASVAAYAYVLYETSQLTAEFSKYGGNVYLNFQYVAFWNEYLTYFTAFIVFVSTLKFVRLLRFNKRMGMLGDVLRVASRDIRQFFLMFFIIFAAFIQTFYLVFMDQLYGYCTFIYTMEQLMQIALGKFKFLDLYIAEPIIGPLIFSAYTIFIIFILLNMFVAILNEAFAKVRDDVEKQENEHEMLDFIIQKVMVSVGMGSSRAARTYFGHNLAESDYRSHSFEEEVGVALPSRIDSLVEFIEKVYFEEAKKKRRRAAAGKAYEIAADGTDATVGVNDGTMESRPTTAGSGKVGGSADRDLTRIYN